MLRSDRQMFSFFLCSFSHICYPHLLICRDHLAGRCRRAHRRQAQHHRRSLQRRREASGRPLHRRSCLRPQGRLVSFSRRVILQRSAQTEKTALKFKYYSLMFFSGGETALHLAALNGHLDSCRLLVEARADLSLRDRCCSRLRARSLCCRTPHTQRCSVGKTALKYAIEQNKADVVAFLRSVGAPE